MEVLVGRMIQRITLLMMRGFRLVVLRVDRNCGMGTERERRWMVQIGILDNFWMGAI